MQRLCESTYKWSLRILPTSTAIFHPWNPNFSHVHDSRIEISTVSRVKSQETHRNSACRVHRGPVSIWRARCSREDAGTAALRLGMSNTFRHVRSPGSQARLCRVRFFLHAPRARTHARRPRHFFPFPYFGISSYRPKAT